MLESPCLFAFEDLESRIGSGERVQGQLATRLVIPPGCWNRRYFPDESRLLSYCDDIHDDGDDNNDRSTHPERPAAHMPHPRSELSYAILASNRPPPLPYRPKSLSPQSPRSAPPTPTTPPLPVPLPFPEISFVSALALAEEINEDDERDGQSNTGPVLPRTCSVPDLKFDYSWTPIIARGYLVHPPLFTTQPTVFYKIASPCFTRFSPATSAGGCTLQGDVPGLKVLPKHRTPSTSVLSRFAGSSGFSAWRFGMRALWNIDEGIRSSRCTHHFHSILEFSSSEEDEDFTSSCNSSNIQHVVKGTIRRVQVYPENRPASHHANIE